MRCVPRGRGARRLVSWRGHRTIPSSTSDGFRGATCRRRADRSRRRRRSGSGRREETSRDRPRRERVLFELWHQRRLRGGPVDDTEDADGLALAAGASPSRAADGLPQITDGCHVGVFHEWWFGLDDDAPEGGLHRPADGGSPSAPPHRHHRCESGRGTSARSGSVSASLGRGPHAVPPVPPSGGHSAPGTTATASISTSAPGTASPLTMATVIAGGSASCGRTSAEAAKPS